MPPLAMPRTCFAASNSCRGFKNYYGEIFTDTRVDRLYIIKGGPGTGKSHFMKAVAARARAVGYTVTECFCSSDPASLDGVLLRREGSPTLGLLDGTAPHVREPAVPGVRDEIVNLGMFWNAGLLREEQGRILALGQAKSAAYDRAYAYLRAAGDVDAVADSLMEDCIRHDRLRALAGRILRHQPDGEVLDILPALRRALGMTGWATLHSFEEAVGAGTLLLPAEYYGVGYRLARELMTISQARRHRLWVSYDPLFPHRIDGLFYPDTGLCVLIGHADPPEGCLTRSLSLRRYTDPEALRRVRGELRQVGTLRDSLTDAATVCLSEVAVHHFELERIYSAAMDFKAKEQYTEAFCRELFGAVGS